MICPVCKTDMIVVEYQNIEIDYCTVCKGAWFDSGELELLLKTCSIEDVEAFMGNITGSPNIESTEQKRKCPICSRKMGKKGIGEKPRLLIDVCGEGHGLWFDGGEIAQLIGWSVGNEKGIEKSENNEVIGFLGEVFNTS